MSDQQGQDQFEWDTEKAARNLQKHGISFEEAQTVFGDPYALSQYDQVHSIDEDRYITMGLSNRARKAMRREEISYAQARK